MSRQLSFLNRLLIPHRHNLSKRIMEPDKPGCRLQPGDRIGWDTSDPRLARCAKDIAEFFLTTFNIKLAVDSSGRAFRMVINSSISDRNSFFLDVQKDNIVLSAGSVHGIWNGIAWLEDELTLAMCPVIPLMKHHETTLFPARMTFSAVMGGFFPGDYLRVLSHMGTSAIVLIVTDNGKNLVGWVCPFSKTTELPEKLIPTPGDHDVETVIKRAREYDLDVYIMPFGAVNVGYWDPRLGKEMEKLMAKCLRGAGAAKGVIILSERFGFVRREAEHPQRMFGWTEAAPKIVSAIRKLMPGKEIIFWPYSQNLRVSFEERKKFFENLPAGAGLMTNFSAPTPLYREKEILYTHDYSIVAPQPSEKHEHAAGICKEHGIPLYPITETNGASWDFLCGDHIPVPQHFIHRCQYLRLEAERNKLTGILDGWSRGDSPSFIADLIRGMLWKSSPANGPENLLKRIAARDWGAGANDALSAWRKFDEAIDHYVPMPEMLYGPAALGPSHPLYLQKFPRELAPGLLRKHVFASDKFAARPPVYTHYPFEYRFFHDRAAVMGACLEKTAALWEQGVARLTKALRKAPVEARPEAERCLGISSALGVIINTCQHVVQWFTLRFGLTRGYWPPMSLTKEQRKNRMKAIGKAEILNSIRAISIYKHVPEVGYDAGEIGIWVSVKSIKRKIAHLRSVLKNELDKFIF